MNAASPRLVTELSEEQVVKMDATYDFVLQMRERITDQYQRWYTIKEAAKYLRVSRTTLTQALKDDIKPMRKGRNVVYDRDDLDAYWMKQKIKQQ